jgi:hypothetical protein
MKALQLRLNKLEKIQSTLLPLIIIRKDDKYRPEQQQQMKEAEKQDRPIKTISIKVVGAAADGQIES